MTRPRDIADSINRINSSAADATAVTIDSSENVGIGLTDPDTPLEIQRGSSGNALKLSSSADGASIFLAFEQQESGTKHVRGRIRAASNGVDGGLIFETGASGSTSERLRILSGGGLTFNGDTATANALDDYEEGTWTPTASTNVSAITSENGHYTKIGNLVMVNFLADLDPTSSSTSMVIGGLPYAVADVISGTGVEATGVVFEDSSLYVMMPLGGSSTIQIELDRPMQGSASASNKIYRGSVTYMTT
mgnify:CR=1 FL=1|tara:strand:- start:669 stop:1415 length:747 start_codon:yes stop_codon:yes gene_type:complete